MARGFEGDACDNSASASGAVYLFTRQANQWGQPLYLKAPNNRANEGFGRAMSLSADGESLAVGAVGEAGSSSGVGGD